MKIAVVFDNQHRPETTGYYALRALSRIVDTEHLLPHELPLIPASLFDLFVFIDDGLDYEIPAALRPRAAWAIDTHMDLSRIVSRFGDSEFLFAAQKNGAGQLSEQLGKDVPWLPLACDPELHRPADGITKDLDIAFVGNFVGERRNHLIRLLIDHYPQSQFCQATFDDMARVYSRARVGFNCSVLDDLNMRLFEVPAHGIPLVTNHIEKNGLDELFDVGKHLLTFDTDDELLEIVNRLLSDDELRHRIGSAGQQHVCSVHTYDLRMQTLLDTVSRSRPQRNSFEKAVDYFEFPRPDVQKLVPDTATRVLDIGCGAGALGADLKRQRDIHVTGIELNAAAASRASQFLDEVVNIPVEDIDADRFVAPFDCIILADVLEHLRDPARTLKHCRQWLLKDGCIVVSVPNSRHHSVISGLIDGNWTYEKAGLLDEDHVRCFTRREIEKLLFRCGFFVEEWMSIPGSGYQQWQDSGRPGEVTVGTMQIADVQPEEAEEFFTYQYVLKARPELPVNYGLTSIVIVTWNQLPYTKECVDSILARTDERIELIFVDNGSTDGTPDYLQTIPDATLIRNDENRGYAPAVNQGIAAARGDNILLLNNDCVVTTGWLDGLLEALHDDPLNGLVGPVSNNVSGEQQIPVSYRDLTSMDGFAWDRRGNRHLSVTDRLVGFCLLFRREVIDRIGLLDEQFEVGCFEDDDFCRRAVEAGYRALVAPHVFVHHYGSATFRGAGIDLERLLKENQTRYDRKWQSESAPDKPQFAAVPQNHGQSYVAHELPNGEYLLQRKCVRLSLCMIVRDNEETIGACLDSIYPWVDEIIIVDTGSTDSTPEICRRFGARMFEFPWCDDFSAARNVSLDPARGEWIFWMDSDDIIPEEQGRNLRALVYDEHEESTLGYVMQVHCPSATPDQMTIVDHVKVFRNLPGLRFEHRIHEQILPAIRRLGGEVAFTEFYVVHSGSDQTPEVRERKLERDFRILAQDLEDHPNHPFVLFNLGMTYEDAQQYPTAEEYLRRCIDVSTAQESHLRKTWALLVNCVAKQGRVSAAVDVASQALQEFKDDPELLFRRATLHHELGNLPAAADDYQEILKARRSREFQSIDPAILGHKLFHNLALVLDEMGKHEEAITHWNAALNDCPEFPAAWMALGRVLIRQQRLDCVPELQSRMPRSGRFRAAHQLLSALCAEANGDSATAVQLLQEAVQNDRDVDCLNELARLLTETQQIEQSVPILEELRSQRPNDPAVLHNLGQAYFATGNQQAARACLVESLDGRPEAISTRELLQTVELDLEKKGQL